MDTTFKQAELEVTERINVLPEDIQWLFTSGLVERILADIEHTYQLTKEETALVGNDFSLILLGFLRKDDLQNTLQTILSPEKKVFIEKIIETFVDEIYVLVADIFESAAPEKNIPINDAATTVQQTPQPAAASHPHIHTMEDDVERIQGYGAYREKYPEQKTVSETTEETVVQSSQDDLLRRNAEVPNYGDAEDTSQ